MFLYFFVEFPLRNSVDDARRVRGRSDGQAKCARRVRGASGGEQLCVQYTSSQKYTVHSNYTVTFRTCMTTAFSVSTEVFVVMVVSGGVSCLSSFSSIKCKASKPSETGRSNFVMYMKF